MPSYLSHKEECLRRLKEYGRNPQKRKAYEQPPDLLLVGVDVSTAKHSACLGTQTARNGRTLALPPPREGLRRFEQTLQAQWGQHPCRRLLLAMEPSGSDWHALYERLKSGGYGVCLVPGQAVRHNRNTMPDGTRNTDEPEADSLFDVLLPGPFFLPVDRDPALRAADRVMQRPMALTKRVSPLRHQLRAAVPRAFPALNPLRKDRTQPTAWRFWPVHPTPEPMLRHGRTRCLAKWPPRRRCGQWRPETCHRSYDLANASIGLQDADRLDEFELTTRAGDLVEALTKHPLWLDKVLELLAQRADSQLLWPLPRIGKPPAAAILTALGEIRASQNGQQRVKLAGRDIRLFARGASLRTRPPIAHVGRADLRDGLSHDALRLVAHAPQFAASSPRRTAPAPGTGAGQRALRAVCDTARRMISRLLTDRAPSAPKKDERLAAYAAAQRPAAET